MGKTVKQNLVNIMKHAQYDHTMARHIGRRRIVEDHTEDKYIRKYKKYDYEDE